MTPIRLSTTDITSLSSTDLRRELAQGLTLTAQVLTRLGAIWAELERRGEDLSDLRAGIARTLPLIASGRLAAEAVVAFAGRPLVLRAMEGVPLAEQRRLADGEPIPVYLPEDDHPHSLPLARIPSAVVSRVIADGIVRTPAEQRAAYRPRKGRKPERRYRVVADRGAQTITIGRHSVPMASVIAALVESSGGAGEVTETPDRPAKVIGVKVTDEERERIEAAAKAHRMTVQELVRRAVLAMWLS